ncbi:DUF2157 domain-containing protein [Thiofilum flexile]|uniref:DUF2157 domain-containing protein n=1 Tax=Thiofilum flexile TaxID=125627 RepID=UPI0003643233|nr:DUF2157 domain-containing protein [Thiofilum flexile]
MAAIETKLKQWLEANLINTEQYQAIEHFEAEHNPPRRLWISVMLLGVAVMGLGIISLIAANWAFIPLLAKLFLALTTLLSVGISVWVLDQHQHPLGFETALTGFLIGCLAMIGLTSQLFHLGGQWYHALFAWGVMTLPLVLFARRLFARFLWVSISLTGLIWTVLALPSPDIPFEVILQVLPILSFLMAVITYYATVLLKPLTNLSSSTLFWMQFSGLVALGYIDGLRTLGEQTDLASYWYITVLILSALVGIGIVLNRKYSLLNRILLISCLLLLLIYYHPTLFFNGITYYNYFWSSNTTTAWWQADDIRAPILTLMILALYATHVGNQGLTTSFTIVTLLIGVRFIILYFQALGGLAATGLGLIVSGALLIAIAWAWQHYRKSLQQWTQELSL